MRTTSVLVAGGGLGLALYVVTRPWAQGDTIAAWAQLSWPVSHVLAMIGFVLLAAAAQRVAVERSVRGLSALSWSAVGLLLPYYGAEAFGLHALGTEGVDHADQVASAVRYGTIQGIAFIAGWVALAAVGVLLARALARGTSDRMLRVAAWVLAAGLALYVPVFYLPPAGRVSHGLLVAAASLLVAWRLPQR